MKSTGIVRKGDELGRIVIPIEIRNKLDIKVKDALEVFTEGHSIILRKHEDCCVFCNGKKDLVHFNNRVICKKCKNKLSKI